MDQNNYRKFGAKCLKKKSKVRLKVEQQWPKTLQITNFITF